MICAGCELCGGLRVVYVCCGLYVCAVGHMCVCGLGYALKFGTNFQFFLGFYPLLSSLGFSLFKCVVLQIAIYVAILSQPFMALLPRSPC